MIRSDTSKPDFFRVSCTDLTSSLAIPSFINASVNLVSIAVKKPPSSPQEYPSADLVSISTSSGSKFNFFPLHSTSKDSPFATLVAIMFVFVFSSALLISGINLP